MAILLCSALLATIVVIEGSEIPRVAVAILVPRSAGATQDIFGSVVLTEINNGLQISGSITGLSDGNYEFDVHEQGDITTCDTPGGYFDPYKTEHGGKEHEIRHTGDLGNVAFTAVGAKNAVTTVNIMHGGLSLRGRNSILGRTLVLHERKDYWDLSGHKTSQTTGNAGARVACGVIGIKSPIYSWNAAVTISPSLILFAVTFLAAYLRV